MVCVVVCASSATSLRKPRLRRAVRVSIAMARGHATSALDAVSAEQPSVVLLGMEEVGDASWAVLAAAGIHLFRAPDVASALRALEEEPAHVVIVGVAHAPALTRALRDRDDLASAHVVVAAALDSPRELRAALDAGADDVMRVPF